MNEIQQLSPSSVWGIFYEILQIPRASKKEEQIIAYLFNFAKKHQLEVKKDKVGNVVIRKEATKGMENVKTVILQSHIDMVCEKNSDIIHNFDTDPIQAYVDNGWLKAKGTTLGADDGIGVAASLALLIEPDIKHGVIECLFTTDEETGMTGAFGLQAGFVKGSILLNLDSEDEGELYIGCAGGVDTIATLPYEKGKMPKGYYSCKISVSGLNGGHSGDEINKGLGNSNKILNRFLWNISQKLNLRISHFDGGNLRNAIPREAWAIVSVPNHDKEKLRAALNIFTSQIEKEFAAVEKKIYLDLETIESPDYVMDIPTQKSLLNAIYACPHGVHAISHEMEGLVETSTNLASVKFKDDAVEIVTSQRSSVETGKDDIASMVASVFLLAGANVEQSDGYPGWKPNTQSEILQVSSDAYHNLFEKTPAIKAIHAGLECGLFLEKYPQLDMVSFGPTVRGAHSPDERIEIESVDKFWKYLIEIIENIPENK